MSRVFVWEGTEHKKFRKKVDSNTDKSHLIYYHSREDQGNLIEFVKRPYKKEAKEHARTALKLVQQELGKFKQNPENIKFLLIDKNYEEYYKNYFDIKNYNKISLKRKEKTLKPLNFMKETGKFKRVI